MRLSDRAANRRTDMGVQREVLNANTYSFTHSFIPQSTHHSLYYSFFCFDLSLTHSRTYSFSNSVVNQKNHHTYSPSPHQKLNFNYKHGHILIHLLNNSLPHLHTHQLTRPFPNLWIFQLLNAVTHLRSHSLTQKLTASLTHPFLNLWMAEFPCRLT